MTDIVLFGAGSAGKWALNHLRSQGIEPLAFADNDTTKWNTVIQGIPIYEPNVCVLKCPDSVWVATTIRHDYASQIRSQIRRLGMPSGPLYEYLPVCHGLPPRSVQCVMAEILRDDNSLREWCNQYNFRKNPDYDTQDEPSNPNELYFPDFISKHEDEFFVDCGAAHGDTVREFLIRWPKYRRITAIEPDYDNMIRLEEEGREIANLTSLRYAVSDHEGWMNFQRNGDFSSHLAIEGADSVCVTRLDDLKLDRPTYIKMDIEGSELEALWGAREILKKHMPVLAVCAYHKSEHLWEIPLLIHAIQPNYELFFRRYAEGAWEIVWYAVPPERVKP